MKAVSKTAPIARNESLQQNYTIGENELALFICTEVSLHRTFSTYKHCQRNAVVQVSPGVRVQLNKFAHIIFSILLDSNVIRDSLAQL